MNFNQWIIAIFSLFILSCNTKQSSKSQPKTAEIFENKGHELIYNMVNKVGDYSALLNKKDVVYTYTYQTPNGNSDISTEKYMFNGELSYGLYQHHQRTFPDLEGEIELGYDGHEYWLKHQGKIINDPKRLKKVAFKRPTNFYWFAMFQKLLDPGVNYKFIGKETINETEYNIVKITFTATDGKPTDIYQVYINSKTLLVDQFLFTVADYDVLDTPNLMQLKYEHVDGMWLPTQRQYKKSTWNANVSNEPWIHVTWSDIKFNNGLTKEDFKK